MPKSPEQPAITLSRSGDGQWSSVNGMNIPAPPEGCETQQLMDWGSVIAVLQAPWIDMSRKLRVAEAYAERWEIPTNG